MMTLSMYYLIPTPSHSLIFKNITNFLLTYCYFLDSSVFNESNATIKVAHLKFDFLKSGLRVSIINLLCVLLRSVIWLLNLKLCSPFNSSFLQVVRNQLRHYENGKRRGRQKAFGKSISQRIFPKDGLLTF